MREKWHHDAWSTVFWVWKGAKNSRSTLNELTSSKIWQLETFKHDQILSNPLLHKNFTDLRTSATPIAEVHLELCRLVCPWWRSYCLSPVSMCPLTQQDLHPMLLHILSLIKLSWARSKDHESGLNWKLWVTNGHGPNARECDSAIFAIADREGSQNRSFMTQWIDIHMLACCALCLKWPSDMIDIMLLLCLLMKPSRFSATFLSEQNLRGKGWALACHWVRWYDSYCPKRPRHASTLNVFPVLTRFNGTFLSWNRQLSGEQMSTVWRCQQPHQSQCAARNRHVHLLKINGSMTF